MRCASCGDQQDGGKYCRSCGQLLGPSPSVETDVRPPGERSAPVGVNAPIVSAYSSPLAAPDSSAAPAPVEDPGAVENNTNVTVNVAGPQIVYQDKTGPSLLVRAIYFFFVGSWLGLLWLFVAVGFNTTIIGLPLGLLMINRLPLVMTLKPRSTRLSLSTNPDGTFTLTRHHVQQRAFLLRAAYFLLVGIWFSFVWALAAYVIGLLIITLPISFWMWDRMPAVTTLTRY